MNIIYEELIKFVPGLRRSTAAGWLSFNSPCCVNNGAKREDKRKRGGLRLLPADDTVLFHCFNCGFVCSWRPGLPLSRKMKAFMGWMGMPPDDVQKLAFEAWRTRENYLANPDRVFESTTFIPKYNEVDLPRGARPINDWLQEENPSKDFLDAVEYLYGRGEDLFASYNYHWTPNKDFFFNRSIIIPFYWDGKIVGWTSRRIDPGTTKYYGSTPAHYLFNNQAMYRSERKFILLVEGVLDAVALDCVGALGNELSHEQISWLKSAGKEIIVVPDREKNGLPLVQTALAQGWSVSIPACDGVSKVWDAGIKDVADAVKMYGKLYTLSTILNAKSTNKLEINLKVKKYMR